MLPAHQRSLQSDAALETSYWKEREWLLRRQKHQCPLDAGGRPTHSLWSFCPQGLERHSRATTFKSQRLSSGSKRSRNSAVAAHVPRSRRNLRAPCVVLAHGMVGPIQDGSGELPILGHWPMVLVTAAFPEAVRADRGRGRGQGSECIVQAGFESRAQSGEERPHALAPYHSCYASSPQQGAGLVSLLVWQPGCWVFWRRSTLWLPGGRGRRNSLCPAWNLLGIGGEWPPGSLTPWPLGVLRAHLACLHLTSLVASLRFVCSDVMKWVLQGKAFRGGKQPWNQARGSAIPVSKNFP